MERGERVQEEENKYGSRVAPKGLRGRDTVGGERAHTEVSVGTERGRRSCACQVFDRMPSNRARSSEAARNTTKSKACMVRLKDVEGRLVVR
jgi:hypothetical protein